MSPQPRTALPASAAPATWEPAGREASRRPAGAQRDEFWYAVIDSPVGELLLAATERGLVRLAYLTTGAEAVLEELADQVSRSPRPARRPGGLDAVRAELAEYFAGRRQRFELPLDRRLITGFRRSVLDATASIAYGEVGTYAEVAGSAGRPGAARAVGGALAANPIAIVIPCHRVLRTGGGIGGYGGGLERKRFLLELEGALPPPLGPAGPGVVR